MEDEVEGMRGGGMRGGGNLGASMGDIMDKVPTERDVEWALKGSPPKSTLLDAL